MTYYSFIHQGLGFAAGDGGFESMLDKKERMAAGVAAGDKTISSMFVRAGEGSKREVTAAEAAAIARREADRAALHRREAADAVSRRMMELKRQREEDKRYEPQLYEPRWFQT